MLTVLEIQQARAPETGVKRLYDQGGLYLELTQSGSRLWRWRYRWERKERRLALGAYPDVSLAKAREGREDARRWLKDGLDPVIMRRRHRPEGATDTLEAVARRWWDDRREQWTDDFARDVWRSLELHLFPTLGQRPIASITPLELLSVLRPLVAQNKRAETVRRIRQRLTEIFHFAILEGLRTDDPAIALKSALPSPTATSMRTIREHEIPQLLADVARAGNPLVTAALKLQLLTATRPGEVREATWAEFDTARGEWTIPAERMKRSREHIVPLSRQALKLLDDLRAMTSHRPLLFPGRLRPSEPMSDNTISSVLKRAGWHGRLTPHGLRSLFNTICNEHRFAGADVIEHALAHVEKSRTRRAYDRGTRLTARRALMQRWADHVDSLIRQWQQAQEASASRS